MEKYVNKKDPHIKEELHQKYKNYRNIIATLMKKSKQNYFTKHFESNIKNRKNIWKAIKRFEQNVRLVYMVCEVLHF